MTQLLKKIDLKNRLVFLLALVVLGISLITAVSLFSLRASMMNERRAKVVSLIDGAMSLVNSVYQQQKSGQLTEAEAKQKVKDMLRQFRYEQSNYLFIYDSDYVRVMLPPAADTEGRNFKDLKDATGKLMLQEMIGLATTKGKGFVDYQFPRPGEEKFSPKIAYVSYFPAWQWMVGTGVYVDDVDIEFWSAAQRDMVIAIVLLFGVATFALVIGRGIVQQIGGEPSYAVDVVRRVAGGDLGVRLMLNKEDNDSLLFRLQGMINELHQVITQVRDSSDSIDTAAKEIAQGNMDLSNRTESQSANLEVTASSMEELTSTVTQNSVNSSQATSLAEAASGVASHGRSAVSEVISKMDAIRRSSVMIEQIIGVIDGIAFQTNILALNAAVEAARAGEQGKGFAVVAAEVRTLAQRSAKASAEIKTLIHESVEQVGEGVLLANQAGTTMDGLVDSVKRVSDILREIARASKEQAAGIADVNGAIVEMEGVTQQNAALVEEAAAAAQSMQEQTQKLVAKVASFKLSPATYRHDTMIND